MTTHPAHQQAAPSPDGNTIILADLALHSKLNQRALDAWRAVRGDRIVPRWKDFDPLEVSEILPSCIFIKRIADDNWPILLFGEDIVSNWGPEKTGENSITLFQPEERPVIIERVRRLTYDPAIVRSVSKLFQEGDDPLIVEWLLLPFADDNGNVDHCLMNAFPADDIDRSDRSQGDGVVKRELLELDFVDLRAS